MKRILLMVLRNLFFIPSGFTRLCLYARKSDTHTDEERHALMQELVQHANKGGNVTIDAEGQENLPSEDGFLLYPNHQGLYDVLALIDSCDHPFSVVMKKELSNIFFLKQVFAVMRAKAIDRDDVKQGLKVILEVAKEVQEGRNFVIFAEGTRSKQGNQPQDFKGGSFKSAMKAKCPIVPVAMIDAFKPFDTGSIAPVTVKVRYLKPLYYEEYKDMKSTEIAQTVKERIEKAIAANI
ncbi:MAG: lysophospholipid acyltransferase family protein [Eubacteriales bacterium]|nr:lysophospholipid acyltransferase family protein [Eubacteriales bacterium]